MAFWNGLNSICAILKRKRERESCCLLFTAPSILSICIAKFAMQIERIDYIERIEGSRVRDGDVVASRSVQRVTYLHPPLPDMNGAQSITEGTSSSEYPLTPPTNEKRVSHSPYRVEETCDSESVVGINSTHRAVRLTCGSGASVYKNTSHVDGLRPENTLSSQALKD